MGFYVILTDKPTIYENSKIKEMNAQMIQLKNVNFAFLAAVLLALAVFVSKSVLVFDAEAIVAVSFLIFMVFAYQNASEMVTTELEERAERIQKEFDLHYRLQEDVLKQLISYHQKRHELSKEVANIAEFCKHEIEYVLSKRQKALEHHLASQIDQKLKTVALKEQSIKQFIQEETSYWFSRYVYETFASAESKQAKDVIIQESIKTIGEMSKR